MRWYFAIPIGAGLAAATIYGFGLGPFRARAVLAPPLTTGSIYVSGPQVYTRERLVNDRYREDAWLLEELTRSTNPDLNFGVSAHLVTFDALHVAGSVSIGLAAPAAAAPSAAPAATPAPAPASAPALAPASGAAQGTAATAPAVVAVDISPFDRFRLRQAYRDQIRSLIIENQLDDRHDLRGNSLYRLGFDVAVLPGENTQASAKVTVSVLPPEGLLGKSVTEASDNKALRDEEIKLADLRSLSALEEDQQGAWRSVYAHWLASVEKRFDDGRATVQNAYDGLHFTPAEYDLLLNSVRAGVRDFWPLLDQASAQLAEYIASPDHKELSDDDRSLLNRIAEEDPSLVDLDAETRQKLEKFHTSYISLDQRQIAELHQTYRAEIDRLLKNVSTERDLLIRLSYLAQKQPAAAKVSSPANANTTPLPAVVGTPLPPPSPPVGATPLLAPQQKADIGCGDLATYGSLPAPPEPFTPHNLSYFLDKAFEPKLFKSVLGLDAGSLRVVASEQGPRTRNLIHLNQLALIGTTYGALGTAFTFQRQTVPLVLTDTVTCFPDTLNRMILSTASGTIELAVSHGITVYFLKKNLEDIWLLAPDYDPKPDIDGIAELWTNAAVPPGSKQAHVDTKTIEVGLINFIRTAGRRLDAFSYALVPSEPDELTQIQAQVDRNRSISVGATGPVSLATIGASTSLGSQTGSNRTGIVTRKQVVGFGDQLNSAIATFGWVINPQDRVSDTEYRQRSSQTSLTALISLPAWLEEVRVRITRSWTDPSGTPDVQLGKPSEYTVELPVNFDTVNASLFETNDRSPAIFEWATESKTIRPCESVDILIPGARLWRSTVVTLGSQKADQIYVLPDMNGIIASFKQVQFPSTWSDLSQDFHAPITVWTSQGSTTGGGAVPIYATFEAAALGKDPKPKVCTPAPERGTAVT